MSNNKLENMIGIITKTRKSVMVINLNNNPSLIQLASFMGNPSDIPKDLKELGICKIDYRANYIYIEVK